jgi:hypothetical protein
MHLPIHRSILHRSILFVLVLVLSIFPSACAAPAAPATPTIPPTAAATATPVPTSTNTPTPLPTDTPTATASPTVTATHDLKATLAVEKTATQVALNEKVKPILADYGVDANLGQVVWADESAYELDGTGYAQGFFTRIDEAGVLSDFVIQSDITWKTSGGLAGCGFLLRAPEDWNVNDGNFYSLELLRLKGAPKWFVNYYEKGFWQYAFPSRAGVISRNLKDDNMNINTVAIHVVGDAFTVYVNGVKEKTVTNNKITAGKVAFLVTQESGTSYCMFTNTWVWAYNPD